MMFEAFEVCRQGCHYHHYLLNLWHNLSGFTLKHLGLWSMGKSMLSLCLQMMFYFTRRTCQQLFQPFIIPHLHSVMSGYKLFVGKFLVMPLNHSNSLSIQSHFLVSYKGFKYLSIFLTPDLKDPFESNCSPLIEKIVDLFADFSPWGS